MFLIKLDNVTWDLCLLKLLQLILVGLSQGKENAPEKLLLRHSQLFKLIKTIIINIVWQIWAFLRKEWCKLTYSIEDDYDGDDQDGDDQDGDDDDCDDDDDDA